LSDPRTIPWFWPVDDLGGHAALPENGFKYDASFQGWLSSQTRYDAIMSCASTTGLVFYHKEFPDFYGHLGSDKEARSRRESFLDLQRQSRVSLAPQSIPGVLPYRFYEAMSAGRVPALFCTGYHLPFQDKIDWDKCTLRFDASRASDAGVLIRRFLDGTSDKTLVEMGRYGKEAWNRWFNRDRQPELVFGILKRLLRGDESVFARRRN
jgi:hypothetical protein